MHELYVYNSLIKSKELFIPENVDRITWYQCGPTVYSDSHIGHARTGYSCTSRRKEVKSTADDSIVLIL